jgi:hypothetical protein
LTEPSASARCKSHEAGALNEKNMVRVLLLLDANRPFGASQEHRHGIQQPHQQHRIRQQWHNQQRYAAQEKCGAAQPQ